MTLVAAPYSIAELGEDEERHEIGNFMDCEGFDVRGYHGEVLIEGQWHTVWQFGSLAEAERFAREWSGVLFDAATQAKVTEGALHKAKRVNLNLLPPGLLSIQRHPNGHFG